MMMAGRFGRTRPRSSLQSRPGSSVGRPESRAASRAESRAGRPPSRVGPRPQSSVGDRPQSRLNRQDSTLYERPVTAKDRMQERLEYMNEARAQELKEKENEPEVDCSTKLKALWMMFSTSFLAKAFVVVGGVVCVFGIVMLAISFATDSFEDGKTVGPILAGVGLIILIIGLLGLRSAYVGQRKVTQEQDPEKGKSQNDKQKNGSLPNDKTNANKLETSTVADDSDKGSDSDVDTTSKPISKSRLEKKNSISPRSGHNIPVVGVARPRTLPPLQMPQKPPGSKRKRKAKTPRKDSLANDAPTYDSYDNGGISTVSSGRDYGVSGVKPSYGNNKSYYGSDNDNNDDDWTSIYRSKTFNYE